MRQLPGLAALAATVTLFGGFAAVGQSGPAPAAGLARLLAQAATAPRPAAEPPRLSAGWPKGYLSGAPLPDSTVLSPPPPAQGSAAEARDLEAARAALSLRDSPRWKLAMVDADVFRPDAASVMSCAAGVAIGPKSTPKLDLLLRRAMSDLAVSTREIKAKHQRPRPFMVNGEPNCTPDHEQALRGDGSYPSGHSAIGYGWGLILAELVPERAARLVARGRAFGDSRRVCNVHWLSDTEEGRVAAAATVARLHAEPAFRADMDAARAELAALGNRAPAGDCAAEAAALGG